MLLPLAPWYTRIGGWMADTSKLAALNLVQIRQGRRHVTTPAEFAAYAAAHEHESLDGYYALPPVNNVREPILPPADAPPRYDHTGLPVAYPVAWPSPHPSLFTVNNNARADFFPAGGRWPNAPTVFLLHGLMSASNLGYRRWAQKFQRHGWNTCFVHLPYHYSRRPPGYFSGELTIGSDLLRTAEGIRQQVKELRQLRRAMERAGATEFGLWATSYGGWIGSLWACVEGGFRFTVLVEPIVDAHDVIWRSPAAYTIRRQLRRTNMTPDAPGTPTIMRLTSAAHHPPMDNPRRVLLLAGTYDTIVTAAGLRTLHARWAGSRFTSGPQGHLGHTLMPESLRQLESGGFLRIAA
ncbi:MAG: hypothetical protein INR62_05920 [Rhodospirillales bacterium]|nr:hypothetical protein [Acetobacter sp.]